MRYALKIVLAFVFLCIVAHPLTGVGRAETEKPVVRIDSEAFSSQDIRDWWLNWREPGMKVPETPQPYVDWLLFVREAEKMALYDDAGFLREVNVYLRVLSLVDLKNEEIDRKIDYSEEKLRAFYEKQLVPQMTLNVLIFKDEESAAKTRADLVAGKVTAAELVKIAGERSTQEQAVNPHGEASIDVAELKKESSAEEPLLGIQENVKKRPYSLEKSWRNAVNGVEKGAFSQPLSWQEAYILLQVVDIIPGSNDDFATMQNVVRNRYRKNQEAILTNALVEGLKKKFAVQVEEERIAKIDVNAPPSSFTDEPVISFSTMKVSEKQLMEKVRQDIAYNVKFGLKTEEADAVLKRVVDGVISQTLITLESLDRHYEQRSPTREVFEFYKRNKLVNRLNDQIRSQIGEIGDDDVAAFYKEHADAFTSPQIYKMALLLGSEEELKKIWLDVVVNKADVATATEDRLGRKPEVKEYPANHLAPEVRERAAVLGKNDLSQVFPLGTEYAILYMVESTPSRTAKLDEVKGMIAKKLQQDKFAAAREDYLKALREKASITIDNKAWGKLREELVTEYENK